MFLSIIIALICWGGVAWAAWRLTAHWFHAEGLAVRWCAAGIIALSFIVVTLEALGLVGLMNCWAASMVSLVAVLAAAIGSRASLTPLDDIRSSHNWIRHRLAEGYGMAACVVSLLAGQAVLRGLKIPPLSWDSLGYHAFFPARWVQLGELAPIAAAGGMDCSRGSPINLELLVAWIILPFGTDLFINFVNFPIILLLGLATYALSRELRVPRQFAIWAPLLACFSRPLWALITTQYSDILLTAALINGIFFFVRYVRTNRWADIIVSAMAFGLALGTKHTGMLIIVMVLGALFIIVSFNLGGQQRAKGVLPTVIAVGFLIGAYTHVWNWVNLGNPIYPWGIAIGNTVLFEASPIISEGIRCFAAGDRSDDWETIKLILSSNPLSWGVAYIVILPVAVFPFFSRANHGRPIRFLVILWLLGLAMFFASDSGATVMVRRGWSEATQRMFGGPMVLAVCLALTVLSRWPWPRGLVAVVPTLILLANHWCGAYPLPLSYEESAVVVLVAVIGLFAVHRGTLQSLLERVLHSRVISGSCLIVMLLLISLGASRLEKKRDFARYEHYAGSIDYHDVPRDCVGAWEQCDEPENPHTVALAGKRHADETDSLVTAILRWFWYPLLGSRHQNRVVYASIYEERDLPTRPYFGGMTDDGVEAVWRANLRRLGVDRLLLIRGAQPETDWIANDVNAFKMIGEWDKCLLYHVDTARLHP